MKKDSRFTQKPNFASNVRKKSFNLNFLLVLLLIICEIGIFLYFPSQVLEENVVRNYGFVFGIGHGGAFIGQIILILFICAIFSFHYYLNLSKTSFLIILMGGLSNTIERIANGYVSDYINFFDVLFFNFADLLIFVGGILCIGEILWKNKK